MKFVVKGLRVRPADRINKLMVARSRQPLKARIPVKHNCTGKRIITGVNGPKLPKTVRTEMKVKSVFRVAFIMELTFYIEF
jgi:hypothetical protein